MHSRTINTMAAELSTICFCIIMLLFVTVASSANNTMPADNEISFAASSPSPSSYLELSESRGDSPLSSSASDYSPPPPPPYIDGLAAEVEAEQLNQAPDYSPSPAPYFTQYPSPPPYIEVEAPEVYVLYTPTEAPAPESSSVFADFVPAPEPSSVFASDELSDSQLGSPDSDMAPNPNVVPSEYRAEDEDVDFDDEYYRSDQNKNKKTMVGFVLGAVCLVGLAGFVVNKKKYNKSKAEYDYDYELAKREDL